MTAAYFVRHARSDFLVRDEELRPLTEQGLKDSELVTEYLSDKGISAIYSSPCKRAFDTVKHFSDIANMPITVIDGFRERRVGKWIDNFEAFSFEQWKDFEYKEDGGESLGETQRRNIAALERLLDVHNGESIAIATHGTALSTIINFYNHQFRHDDFWRIIDKMPFIVRIDFGHSGQIIEEIDLL